VYMCSLLRTDGKLLLCSDDTLFLQTYGMFHMSDQMVNCAVPLLSALDPSTTRLTIWSDVCNALLVVICKGFIIFSAEQVVWRYSVSWMKNMGTSTVS